MGQVTAVRAIRMLVAALIVVGCISPVCANNDRLRDQLRQRQQVIDTEVRVLQQQALTAEFGGPLYRELRRTISALEGERSSLRRLDSALNFGREGEIERRQAEYQRARDQSLRAKRSLTDARTRELQFGSRSWRDHRRMSTSLQQQSASRPFGPEYRRSLEIQIRVLEGQRSQLEFGSAQWRAVNRQITALRQALRSVR